MDRRYEIQIINKGTKEENYRIIDTETDSRVATCYLPENATLVCSALNTALSFNAVQAAKVPYGNN